MTRLSRRLAAFVFAIVVAAFLGHGAALASAIACIEVAEDDARAQGHGHQQHHETDRAPASGGGHHVCCTAACPIAAAPDAIRFAASTGAVPAAIGPPEPREADPFRIDRPPRALIA